LHPDLRGVRTVAGDYHQHDLSQAMTRDNGALTADILHTWQRLGDNRSTFCFAVDRDHARQLKEQFEAAGVPSAYMDAWYQTPASWKNCWHTRKPPRPSTTSGQTIIAVRRCRCQRLN
jgi:hypothetical protein